MLCKMSCHVKCALVSVLVCSVSWCLCATQEPPLDGHTGSCTSEIEDELLAPPDDAIASKALVANPPTASGDGPQADHGSILWRWLTFLMSRSGVYLTLVTLITFNFLGKAFKDKLGMGPPPAKSVSDFDQPRWQNLRNKWQHSSELPTDIQNSHTSDDDTDSIKERLREAEMTMAALKAELEETQRTKMTLENSLEELEKDRSSSEDELMKTRMAGALKMENLKKENACLERQLERTKAEVESLTQEVENLQREARISDSALRDQQILSERLEATRAELEEVKSQLKGIKIERDTAVRLASEQIYKKMTSDGSVQRRELIEEMIDMELKRVREEEEALHERGQDLLMSQSVYIDNNDTQIDAEPTTSYPHPAHSLSSTHNPPLIHRNAVGDAPACTCPDETYNITTETSTYSNLDRTVSTSDDCTDEDSERPHIVTGSPAFRAFLRSNFGAPA